MLALASGDADALAKTGQPELAGDKLAAASLLKPNPVKL